MVEIRLLKARVFHKRIKPENLFCYKAGYIALPLIGSCKKPKLFSFDDFNLFSFYNRDHAYRNGGSVIDWVFERLQDLSISKDQISQVVLITHPRCLGFVFNPVSFYFCLNAQDKPLAVIAEVNNTFGQTHSYLICEKDSQPILENKIYRADKEFFVSPFFRREGNYEFRFAYSDTKIAVFVDYFKDQKLMFETSLVGNLVDFCPKNTIPYVFTTFKTVILIGFQALKLIFIKKLKFKKPPEQLQKRITKANYDE